MDTMSAAARTYLLFFVIVAIGSFGTSFTRALWHFNATAGLASMWTFVLIGGYIGIAFARALAGTIREDAKKKDDKQTRSSQ
jgi:hypothetical protein